jgi:multidrug resistance efflux pump
VAIPFENTLSASGNGSLRTGWWLSGIGAVIILVWGFVAFSIDLPVTVSSADGRTVSATESLDISSISDAPISALPYQLGDAVAPGDVLISFDTEPLRLELTRSRERLAALRQEIESIDLEIASIADSLTGELDSYDMAIEALAARTEETEAELRYAREAEALYRQFRAERQIDALQYARAHTEVAQIELQLQAQEAEYSELLANKRLAMSRNETARAQLLRHRAGLAGQLAELQPEQRKIEHRIDELTVRAPFAGRIGAMAGVAVGQSLQPGDWLMTVVPDREFEFQATFIANDAAGRLRVEQPARIRFYALPWTEFGTLDAQVLRVGTEERNGTVRVDFTLDTDAELAAQLSHGLKGEAVIQIDEATLAQRMFRLLNRPGRAERHAAAPLPVQHAAAR